MSFIQFKLTKSINQERGIFDKYIYSSVTDTIAEVSTAGYFDESRFIGEWDKSIIECLCVDGYFIGKISTVGNSVSVLITSSGSGGQNGFIDYNDTSTASSPLVLSGGVWTTIPNDGLGVASNDTYPPSGVTELLDVSSGAIDASELSLGDTVIIRNDYLVTPGTNNTLLEFRYSLGTGGGIYTLEKIIGRLDSGSGQPYRFSLSTDLIYMGDLNTKDSPIILQAKLSANGTLVNNGTVIQVIKR